MTEEISQNELLALRRAKLDDLRSKGNAFPNDFRRDALAEELHTAYDSFEKDKLERKRYIKNEPRTCDIDIIDFEGKAINFKSKTFDFTVPHKELIYRNFVLFPLEEIFPEWKHPITKEPVKTLIEKLSTEDKNSILKINKT